MSYVFRALANVTPARSPSPPASPEEIVDPEPYVGSYAAGLSRYDVTAGVNGDLAVRLTALGEIAQMVPTEPEDFTVVPRDGTPDAFISTRPFDGDYLAMCFIGDDGQGRAKYLHNGRAHARLS